MMESEGNAVDRARMRPRGWEGSRQILYFFSYECVFFARGERE